MRHSINRFLLLSKKQFIFILITTSVSLMSDSVNKVPDVWWERSSYSYNEQLQNQWLFHLELLIDRDYERGNVDKIDDIFNANAMLRYGHLSIGSNYIYMKEKLKAYQTKDNPSATVTSIEYQFKTYLLYDINSMFFTVLAHKFSRKEETIIYNRHTYYTGVGINLLNNKKHIWNVIAYVARDNIKFQNEQNNIGHTPAYMLEQNYRFIYNKDIYFNILAYYMYEDVDNHDEYEWEFKLNVQVIKPVSIVPYVSLTHYDFMTLTNQFENETKYGVKISINF